ncbi:heterokaryon incompatibility protein-domain-containing protein [Fusarium oxysporum f. sp. albedinis]|nr:heterokaryon incompatibility protein-domain-containing protein [Fusarium oxysporum f. sp. albedinis]
MSAALTARLAQPYPGPSLPSPSHIRLVYLHPGTDEAVYCELITVSIESAPSYEALSYTWGDPSRRESINMTTQGSETTQQFSVTSNCYSALKRFRYRDRTRVLWIDALAIDQSNVDERNYQVSLMSRIYSQAASVVVYLGESGDNSDLAIAFIMECDDPSQGTTSLSFPKSDILMDALRNFFLRPWFTRVWVIQEVFLSTDKIIYCGEKELSWSAMENFKHYLVNTRLRFRLPYRTTEELLLRDLLDSRHCEATDPRDKVYSLLPILQSFNKSLGLIPRYQDTPEKIYTDCALSLLPSCGWKILYARCIIGTAPWLEMSSFWTDKVLPGVPRKPQIILRSSDKGQIPVLHGHGYSCGKTLKLGSTYIAGETPFPAKEWYNLVNKIDVSTRVDKFGSGSPDPKFPHRTESLVKFLRLARYLYSSSMKEEEEDPADDLPRPDFVIGGARSSYEGYRFGSKWEDTIRKLATERKDGVLPFRDIHFHYAAAGWPPSYGNTIRGNLEACHLRRCFVTDTGYFGLAPAEAENGDWVFLCVGASVPFVLRETQSNGGDEFDLVGESYLQAGAWFEMVNNDSQPQALYII